MKKKIAVLLSLMMLLLPVLEAQAIIWRLPDRSWHSRTIYVIHIGDPGPGRPVARVSKNKLALVEGRTHKLQLNGVGKAKVTWSSSNPRVATVSSSGEVRALKKGTAKITGKANNQSSSCTVRVSSAVWAKSISLTKINHIMLVGESQYVDYRISPDVSRITEGYSVTWGTSDPRIVDVDKEGKITVKGEGTATISAKLTYKKGKSKTARITIKTETGRTRYNKWIKRQGYSVTDGGNTIRRENGKWVFRCEKLDERYPSIAEMRVNSSFTGKVKLYVKQWDNYGGVWCEGTAEANFKEMYNHSKYSWDFTSLSISKYRAADLANVAIPVLLSSFQVLLTDRAKMGWADLGMPYFDY